MQKVILGAAIILLFSSVNAQAEQEVKAFVPVKTSIVQCGTKNELHKACEMDDRCCALRDQFWGKRHSEARVQNVSLNIGEEITLSDAGLYHVQ